MKVDGQKNKIQAPKAERWHPLYGALVLYYYRIELQMILPSMYSLKRQRLLHGYFFDTLL